MGRNRNFFQGENTVPVHALEFNAVEALFIVVFVIIVKYLPEFRILRGEIKAFAVFLRPVRIGKIHDGVQPACGRVIQADVVLRADIRPYVERIRISRGKILRYAGGPDIGKYDIFRRVSLFSAAILFARGAAYRQRKPHYEPQSNGQKLFEFHHSSPYFYFCSIPRLILSNRRS